MFYHILQRLVLKRSEITFLYIFQILFEFFFCFHHLSTSLHNKILNFLIKFRRNIKFEIPPNHKKHTSLLNTFETFGLKFLPFFHSRRVYGCKQFNLSFKILSKVQIGGNGKGKISNQKKTSLMLNV